MLVLAPWCSFAVADVEVEVVVAIVVEVVASVGCERAGAPVLVREDGGTKSRLSSRIPQLMGVLDLLVLRRRLLADSGARFGFGVYPYLATSERLRPISFFSTC